MDYRNWINTFMTAITNAFSAVVSFFSSATSLVATYKYQSVLLLFLIAGGWAMAKGSKMFSVNTKLNIGKK